MCYTSKNGKDDKRIPSGFITKLERQKANLLFHHNNKDKTVTTVNFRFASEAEARQWYIALNAFVN